MPVLWFVWPVLALGMKSMHGQVFHPVRCSRMSYMQRHPPVTPGPCVLADVVREAPRLLDFLPPESWSALSASSSLLRQLGHSFTQIVSVDTKDDLPVLCKHSWPQLALVVVRKDH